MDAAQETKNPLPTDQKPDMREIIEHDEFDGFSRSDLVKMVKHLMKENQDLRKMVEDLRKEVAYLKKENEDLRKKVDDVVRTNQEHLATIN